MRTIKMLFAGIAMLFSALAWATPINVNTATAEQIAEAMKGVGQTIAERIVEERDTNGRFKDADDLRERVRGVGPATLENNAEKITFK